MFNPNDLPPDYIAFLNESEALTAETLVPQIEGAISRLELPRFAKVAERSALAIMAAKEGDLEEAWNNLVDATWIDFDLRGEEHGEFSRLSSMLAQKLQIIDDTAYFRHKAKLRAESGGTDGS